MDLNTLWFILIAVLYTGYFFLEGFDYGVGILLPFVGKSDAERRQVINSIGPFWDGNEVWLLTAGGATFAAFPHWYATLFSGFYLALFLMLVGLIVRGVAFEYRSKHDSPAWRSLWDWAIFTGSALPALLIGVAFTNLLRGVPIDPSMTYVGGFFNLLNPHALLGGLVSLGFFTYHGALFLGLKTEGPVHTRVKTLTGSLGLAAAILLLALGLHTLLAIPTHGLKGTIALILGGTAALLAFGSWALARKGNEGWPFTMGALSIVLTSVSFFLLLFPNVMVSSLGTDLNLTIHNASSTPYTLKVMSIVAGIFVPVVLAYQGWTYWTFRKRVSSRPEHLTY